MSRPTQDTAERMTDYVYGTVTLYGLAFQKIPLLIHSSVLQSYNLHSAETKWIWALPRSIATTGGITIVFFSSGYLDVSVPRVCFPGKPGMSCLRHDGLPHSEIYGSKVICTSP